MFKAAYMRGRDLLMRVKEQRLWSACASSEAAQIVELAITLPVLVGLWYGIFDFGQAFNLKQKLSDATREAARYASNENTSDLTASTTPQSILNVRNAVSAYLIANNVNDCGLVTASATQAPTYTWTFTATCPAGVLTLRINRGKIIAIGSGSTAVTLEATQVEVVYPYQWQFGRAVKLLSPTATFAGPTQIPSSAIMPNIS